MKAILSMATGANRTRLLKVAVGIIVCGIIAIQVDATTEVKAKFKSLKGLVTDSQGRPIVDAIVYFIDSSTIDTTPITVAAILDGSAEPYDEPLEDIINNADKVKALPQAKTNSKGQFRIKKLKAAAHYFPYVVPDAKDTDHLPGGDASRKAFAPIALGKKGGLHIQLSWPPPSDASYVGTSACLVCHGSDANDDMGIVMKKHGHQVGFMQPEKLTANQSLSAHSETGLFLAKFTEATAYSNAGVKVIFFEDYDGTRGSDKFKVFEDKTGGGKVYMKAYLWKTSGKYKVTVVNQLNSADPMSPMTLNVTLTYGGSVYKQRLIVDAPGRKGHYIFLQFQAFTNSMGSNSNYERTRKVIIDYKCSYFFGAGPDGTFGTADDVLKLPDPEETFEGQCAGCHFTGFKAWVDPTTEEILASAVPDENGALDIEGNGQAEEINIGCEACHGPGSKHRDEALQVVLSGTTRGKTKNLDNHKAKYIVQPNMLSAERATVLCGHCHDRTTSKSRSGLRKCRSMLTTKFRDRASAGRSIWRIT